MSNRKTSLCYLIVTVSAVLCMFYYLNVPRGAIRSTRSLDVRPIKYQVRSFHSSTFKPYNRQLGPKYPPTKGDVWPKPKHQVRQDVYYTLNAMHFRMEVTHETCQTLTNAIDRFTNIVRGIGRRRRETRRKGINDGRNNGTLEVLLVKLNEPCEKYPHFDMDESYKLSISSVATLESRSVWGVLRGLETFVQLLYLSDDRNELLIHATEIYDEPRYQHRGLLLDTSRHYISVANIRRTLDAMAINKMNVFHWHIVDDQSFPYQSERFPEISEQGAYDPSMVYTREDIEGVVQYARERGIRVVPEFDVPGHTRSWGEAYPDLLAKCFKKNKYVGLGPMNPINDFTYKLLRELFQEVQNWFPDQYFHIGGDEIVLDCWKSNPQIQSYMKHHKINVKGLHALFMRRAIPLLANGSKVIVWQEVFDNGVPLAKDTLIQVWKYVWQREMVEILKNGHKVLFSSSWYLDYLNDKWEKLYAADPRQMVIDISSDKKLAEGVVGGEACMWGEMVDDRNVIERVWPRTSAVAERLWSFNIGERPELLTYQRLEEHTCRMIQRGIGAEPASGPGFCIV